MRFLKLPFTFLSLVLCCVLFTGTATAQCTAPVVASLSPASGPANTLVTLTGTGYEAGTGTSSVKFNGVEAPGFTVVSNTSIKVFVPAGATSGSISVTTNGCTATAQAFTVTATSCGIASGTGNEIYISELYDQWRLSGGMIELYNPTNTTISLTGYTLKRYGNITDTSTTNDYILNLSGTIGPESTYLVACSTPLQNICAAPAQNASFGNGFNENDKIELLKNNVIIDVAHTVFPDAGFTMIRKDNAVAPKNTFNASDWNNTLHTITNQNQEPESYCSTLGWHDALLVVPPVLIQQPISQTVCEATAAQFTVALDNPVNVTYQWKMLTAAGLWVNVPNGAVYSGATTAQLTINTTVPANVATQFYCMITAPTCIIISNTAQLTISPLPLVIVTRIHPSCTITTGSITILPQVGENLTYSFNGGPFQSGTTFTNIAPGTYDLDILSGENCPNTVSVTIDPVPTAPATPIAVPTHATCTVPQGVITITNPLAGLEYSIGGAFQASPVFNNVPANTYTVTVRNAAGCTSTASVTINAAPNTPGVPSVTPGHPACGQTLGTITINNPVAGLEYSIGGAFQTSGVFSGVIPGNYTVTVRNANGCTNSVAVIVNPVPVTPITPVAATTHPGCGQTSGTITVTNPQSGVEYSIGGAYQTAALFSNVAPGVYTLTARNTAAGACTATTSVTVNQAPASPVTPIASATHPACGETFGTITINNPETGVEYSIGGAYQTSPLFTNVVAGNYTITARNTATCTTTATITVNPAPTTIAPPTVAATHPACGETFGTITVSNAIAGLEYSIGGAFQATATFIDVTPGNYTVTARNASGCTSSANIIVNPAPTGADIQITGNEGCVQTTFGNNYVLEALPVNNSFDVNTANFTWENQQGAVIPGQTENTFNASQYIAANVTNPQYPMQFTVTVTLPGGCSDSYDFIVNRTFCDIQKGISPNNDGLNDSFDLAGLNVNKLMIFNRYGKEVYSKGNYTNEWQGQDNNSNNLPTGTYYYVIDSPQQNATGWIYINREEN